jgi:hypothetical protein
MNFLLDIAGNAGNTGSVSPYELANLQKALSAGYGTDIATREGGGALAIQSLDKQLKLTIAEQKNMRLLNRVMKSDATATIDEWTDQTGVGGFLGSSTNTEDGIITDSTGIYKRQFAEVKYLMDRRAVSLVSKMQNNIIDPEVAEQRSGIIKILSDVEYLSFEGDSRAVPTEFDGLEAVLEKQNLRDNIYNLNGQPLRDIKVVTNAASYIAGYGNFGQATDIFCSQRVQADFDNNLDPAFRVPLTDVAAGGLQIGAPVRGLRTSWGDIATQADVFIKDGEQKVPFQLENPQQAKQAAKNNFAPTSVTASGTGTDAASTFTAARGGNYFYAVTGLNKQGASVAVVTSQVAIGAGGKGTLTIVPSVSGEETGYVIYRSRQNGSNALADMREMCRIPRAATGNTVYVDNGQAIPGTTKAYILTADPAYDAISLRELMKMFRFNLAVTATATMQWAQLWFGYMRYTKPRQHVLVRNILPANAAWQPFAV